MLTMRALCFEGGTLRFRPDVPTPQVGGGDVLVNVTCAGICATDLEIVKGYMGFSGVPGHEFAGIVKTGPMAGRRVVGEINAACGTCELCRAGDGRHCAQRTVLGILKRNGAFAEFLTLPSENIFEIPANVTDDEAAFTEPLAAALALIEAAPESLLRPAARVAVLGDGRLGILCAVALADAGISVTLIGRNPQKLQAARSCLLRPAKQPLETVRANDASLAGLQRSFDVVVDATGSERGLATALDLVRPRGLILLKTTTASPPAVSIARVVIDEITLRGSRCGRFAPALSLLASGRITVAPLIHARFPLEDGVAALTHATKQGVLKVLLDIQQPTAAR